MKTTYSNVKNPKRLTWILGVVVIAGYAAYLAYFFLIDQDFTGWHILLMLLYLAGVTSLVGIPLTSVKCTVDEEAGTLITPENKKNPMLIANIDRITRVTNRKGRLRYLNIHEAGVRYVNVQLLPTQAGNLIQHLCRINPAIKVQDRNYM